MATTGAASQLVKTYILLGVRSPLDLVGKELKRAWPSVWRELKETIPTVIKKVKGD